MTLMYLALVASAVFGACGQVLLKAGAHGQSAAGMLNWSVFAGFVLYGVGAVLWLFALTKLPLHSVYPFTLLTLALVFGASIVVLGERPNMGALGGWLLIAAGIAVVAWSSSVDHT